METPKPEGSLSETAGKAKEAAGDLVDSVGTQVSGKVTELGDKAQQLCSDFTGILRDSTVERPFAALAFAAGVGFLLGLLRAAKRPRPGNSGRDWKDQD